MTYSADGGWFFGIILLLAFVALGVAAYRKRWAAPRLRLATQDGVPVQDNKPAPSKEAGNKPSGKDNGGFTFRLSKPLKDAILGCMLVVLGLAVVIMLLLMVPRAFNGFIHTAFGDHIVYRLPSTTHPAAQRASALQQAPAQAQAGSQAACPPWSQDRHVCVLTGATMITQEPGLPAGLTFCWTPAADSASADSNDRRWRSIRAILVSGDTVDFDPDHPLEGLAGYEFTPAHKRQVLTYWFSDSPSCT